MWSTPPTASACLRASIKLEMHGVVKDYIKVRYAKNDTLYVPVTQLDLVSKYIGPREDGRSS